MIAFLLRVGAFFYGIHQRSEACCADPDFWDDVRSA